MTTLTGKFGLGLASGLSGNSGDVIGPALPPGPFVDELTDAGTGTEALSLHTPDADPLGNGYSAFPALFPDGEAIFDKDIDRAKGVASQTRGSIFTLPCYNGFIQWDVTFETVADPGAGFSEAAVIALSSVPEKDLRVSIVQTPGSLVLQLAIFQPDTVVISDTIVSGIVGTHTAKVQYTQSTGDVTLKLDARTTVNGTTDAGLIFNTGLVRFVNADTDITRFNLDDVLS